MTWVFRIQPNDAGVNRALHVALAAIQANWQAKNRDIKMNLASWNGMFVECWHTFIRDQHTHLKTCAKNCVTSGWDNVGLVTGNIHRSKYWGHAIESLGTLLKLGREDGGAGETAPSGPTVVYSAQLQKMANHKRSIFATPVRERRDLIIIDHPLTQPSCEVHSKAFVFQSYILASYFIHFSLGPSGPWGVFSWCSWFKMECFEDSFGVEIGGQFNGRRTTSRIANDRFRTFQLRGRRLLGRVAH